MKGTVGPGAGVVWSWRFHKPADLKAALEEYTAHLDDAGIAKYGEQLSGGNEEEREDQELICKMRIRSEIDHCMDALAYPFFHRLLDLYYRAGLSCEHNGWSRVAKRLGLRGNPKSRWDRDTFDRQVELAIDRLWRVHDDRYQRGT